MIQIPSLRPAFSVLAIEAPSGWPQKIALHLSRAGYNCEVCPDRDSLWEELTESPPHILLFQLGDLEGDVQWIGRVKDVLPETHLIAVASSGQAGRISALVSKGIYDGFVFDEQNLDAWLRCCDHAVERDYFMYRNELDQDASAVGGEDESEAPSPTSNEATIEASDVERQAGTESPERGPGTESPERRPGTESPSEPGLVNGTFRLTWLTSLLSASSTGSATDSYVNNLSAMTGGLPVLFLKYVPNYHSLVPSHAVGVEGEKWKGLGLQLNDVEPAFHPEKLNSPMTLTSLRDLILQVLGFQHFSAYSVRTSEGIRGVSVILSKDSSRPWTDEHLLALNKSFENVLERLLLERRLHTINSVDLTTQVLNRQGFLKKLADEISRSRRLKLPVSLLTIALDDPSSQGVVPGGTEFDVLLKMVAAIFRRNSRVNDVIGRTGSVEFGLVLPHTSQKGASVKAERLRRIVESADFSRVIASAPKVTVSIGLSEYPSLCLDGDELIQSADEALFQVKKLGGNRVCLASVPVDFVPDFQLSNGT